MNDPGTDYLFTKAKSPAPTVPGTDYPRREACGAFISDDKGDRQCDTITVKRTPLERCGECKARRTEASRKRRSKVSEQHRKDRRNAR